MAGNLKGVFGASMSVFKADLSLNIEGTIQHAKENLDDVGVSTAFMGSTGAGALISLDEKKELIRALSKHKFKEQILIGTALTSLKDTISLMKHAIEFNQVNFLIMPCCYFQNTDESVYNWYSKIIHFVPESKIVLYNFSKLNGGYAFSSEVTKRLINDFPSNIIGMKESTGNLWDNFKAENFLMFVGSEKKLAANLKIGGVGTISATLNFSGSLAKKVYDDCIKNGSSPENKKLQDIRTAFDETGNLISALHTLKSIENKAYANLPPPLELLSESKKEELIKKLKELGVLNNKNIAA